MTSMSTPAKTGRCTQTLASHCILFLPTRRARRSRDRTVRHVHLRDLRLGHRHLEPQRVERCETDDARVLPEILADLDISIRDDAVEGGADETVTDVLRSEPCARGSRLERQRNRATLRHPEL